MPKCKEPKSVIRSIWVQSYRKQDGLHFVTYGMGNHGTAVIDAQQFVQEVAVDGSASHSAEFSGGTIEIDVLADIATVDGSIEVAVFVATEPFHTVEVGHKYY